MIRPFQIEDSCSICDMLMAEGLTQDQMAFMEHETWVYEDDGVKGFYTFKIDHDIFPHLQHFCIARGSRGGSIARALIRHFKKKVKRYKKAIVNSPNSNEFVDMVIRAYFGVDKPYAINETLRFYLVEV